MTILLDDLKSITVGNVTLKRIIHVPTNRVIWVPHDYRCKIYSGPERWSEYIYGR